MLKNHSLNHKSLRLTKSECIKTLRAALDDEIYTPDALLAILANNRDMRLRFAVASNQITSDTLLRKLANDEDGDVRAAVAENPNTPVALLEEFAEDEAPAVRAAVIKRAKELADTDFAAYVTAIAKSYD